MDTVSIDLKTLNSLIGSARAPLIVDVRRAPAFDANRVLIPGAVRPEGDLPGYVAPIAAGRQIVAYCVAGHEVSQRAAATLRAAGYDARYLEGGLEAWIAAGFPTAAREAP
jgi:rhodanese-related sulfurtransferase